MRATWVLACGVVLAACGGEPARRAIEAREARAPSAAPAPGGGPRSAPQVRLGYHRLCVVTEAGRLWCLGENNMGQLGDGTNLDSAEPVFARGLEGVAEVAIGKAHTCARTHAGTVSCWGDNMNGQLGDGTLRFSLDPSPVPGLNGVVELVAEGDRTMARREDGTMACWGFPCPDIPPPAEGANEREYRDALVGSMYARPLRLDESNMLLALEPRMLTQHRGAGRYSLSSTHECGIDDQERVLCFGNNLQYQLGFEQPDYSARLRPVPGLGKVRQVVAHEAQTCALEVGGEVRCWGGAYGGEREEPFADFAPRLVTTLDGAVDLDRGDLLLCGVTGDGRVPCVSWMFGLFTSVAERGPLHARDFVGVADAVDVAVTGADDLCILRRDGSVLCDFEYPGPMVDTSRDSSDAPPARVPGIDGARGLALGYDASCAILRDATVACWGPGIPRRVPGPLGPEPVPGLTEVEQLVVGEDRACARRTGGEVLCWTFVGLPDAEIAELGALPTNAEPALVEGLADARQLSMTYDHACALRASGEVACWGLDNFGQLGDRATTSRSTPVAVQGLGPVTQVAAGGVHTCALEASGEILCWGVNGNGQLGDGTVEGTRPAPTKVVGITDAVEIGAGSRFTCARRANGQVLCWGQGCENQLGNGRCESEPRPRVVDGLPPAAELRVGAGTACIRSGSGEVRCWGRSGLPEPLPADVQEVAPGAYHACALTRSGDVLCWGFRGYLGGVRHLGLWSIQPPST